MSQLKVLTFKNRNSHQFTVRTKDGEEIISVVRKCDGRVMYKNQRKIKIIRDVQYMYCLQSFCEDLIHVNYDTRIRYPTGIKTITHSKEHINDIE